uniref:Uncharacterized protein n=1 Tax=Anguilla anguilla TaxID=7936 RepID=A0A0E9UE97_ANGAN
MSASVKETPPSGIYTAQKNSLKQKWCSTLHVNHHNFQHDLRVYLQILLFHII